MGPEDHVGRTVVRDIRDLGDEPRLFGGVEHVELCQGAIQLDPARRRVGKAEGNQAGKLVPVARFHDEMGDLPCDRVHDDTAQLAAYPIGAADLGPDGELLRSWHGQAPYAGGRDDTARTRGYSRRTGHGEEVRENA